MKKKVLVLLFVGGFLVGGGTVFAGSNYYANLLEGQEDQIKDELMESYEAEQDELSKQLHNDMVMAVEYERQDLINYFEGKMDEIAGIEVDERREEHTQAVRDAKNRVREAIYEMFEEELDQEIPRG